MNKPVILTAPRVSSDLHIGNYFGALLPIIDMAKNHADRYQINLFIADIHGLTTPIDYSNVQNIVNGYLKTFVAAGIQLNHPSVHLYRQSRVPAISELAIILNNFAGVGELGRMTQFKDKSAKINADRISAGLFVYPVLMAVDILAYGASYVPVGDDQSQHLEFTRDIAIRINKRFDQELFTVPQDVVKQHEFFGKDQGLRIKDLLDPTKKMSKSDETGKGVILLQDDPKVATKKIMNATTDSLGKISYDPKNQPGISNLLTLLGLFTSTDLKTVVGQYEGETQYGQLKSAVADATEKFLTNFQNAYNHVDMHRVSTKLAQSEAVMNETANETLLRVQKAVGLR